jgi:signal transduction histidine kinase
MNDKLILESLDNGIIIVDEELNVTYWNRWMEEKTSIKKESILNAQLDIFYLELNGTLLKSKVKKVLQSKQAQQLDIQQDSYLIQIEIDNTDFEYMQQSITIAPYQDELVAIFIYDQTSLLQTQKQLIDLNSNLKELVKQKTDELIKKDDLLAKQSRLAEMGEMIGNIAHQWRQPLNNLSWIIEEIRFSVSLDRVDTKELVKSLDNSKDLIHYMSNTIDDFMNFFRKDKEKQYFLLDTLMEKVISFVSASMTSKGIELVVDCPHDIKVYGFFNELSQAILNIVNNAKDALNTNFVVNPTIKITASKEEIENYVLLKISDNAGGVPQHIIDKVFDPYFTTKHPSQGTGLGLYIAKTIIEKNMGGKLQVKNIGDGAEFALLVPLH